MIKTKIIATVGPACRDVATLRSLIEAGVDVFRLNFSHGTLAEHEAALTRIREACQTDQAVVAVMGDLCGPKIRVGEIEGGQCELIEGATLVIQRSPISGSARRISTNYERFVDEVDVGSRVLIDDGTLRLTVTDKAADEVTCRVEVGGILRPRKGLNLPDTDVSSPALTDKDRRDLAWAVEHDLDYIALSFVRQAEDMRRLRHALDEAGSNMPIISKIEKPQAIDRLDEIIAQSDVVLVARGDLGVEMDVARVPLLQKDITRRCLRAGKPVIVATQMLQTMVDSPTPTRAEVSDVANAILDSADAVMLSAETSVGQYPVKAVQMMSRIAEQTEAFLDRSSVRSNEAVSALAATVVSAAADGASVLARALQAKLVVAWSESGHTSVVLSKHRLSQTIFAFCESEAVARRMSLLYGVRPVSIARPANPGELIERVDEYLLEHRLAERGDTAIVVSRTRLGAGSAPNAIVIHHIGAEPAGPPTAPTP